MMYSMQNRKMPSMRSVRIYLIASFVLALLGALMPIVNLFTVLAICFASVALLSIPKMTYPRILLILAASALAIAALAYLISQNAAYCFAAASFAPAVALLTLTIRKHRSRTCGILLASIGLGLFYLAFYALAVYLTYNRFSLDLFKELYHSMEEQLLLAYEEYMNSETAAQLVAVSEEELLEVLKLSVSILPALFIDLMLGTVWLATVLLRAIFKGYLYGAERFADWKVTMNRPISLLFCLLTLLGLLPISDDTGIWAAVLTNLLLILIPGFFCVGCSVWKARLFSGKHRSSVLLVTVLVLFAIIMTPAFFIYFIALTGAMQPLMPRFKPIPPHREDRP